MRKFCALLIVMLVAVVNIANSQTLFTYGKNSVSKEEFLRAFNKNPSADADRKNALKEYLDLYINFKLKVQAAYEAKLDIDENYKYETENFRNGLADNFINDEANIKALVNEAFQRSQKDIHLEQIFVEFPQGGDTTKAYKKIWEAYKELTTGKFFDKINTQFSSDPSGIDLGYITVFTLPYQFETVVYSLKEGGFSAPVRSAYGYHIFKNASERPAIGRRRASQILFGFPPAVNVAEKTRIKTKADSIYNVLVQHPDQWDEMVSTFSNDITTAHSHGLMAEFGIGQFSPGFENAAFALKDKGEVSKPIETNYGYHILKLEEVIPVAKDLNDPVIAAGFKERVEKDDRLTEAKKMLVNKWMKLTNYKPATFDQNELWIYADSFYQNKSTKGFKNIKDEIVVFTFAKKKVTAVEFARYAKAAKAARMYQLMSYADIFKEYTRSASSEYYKTHLEDYNLDYKMQVKEFNEANLLFAIMDQQVWTKASSDEKALKGFYEKNKVKYQWAPSADAIIVTAPDQQTATEIQQKISADPLNWRAATQGYTNQVMADSNRYELNQIPVAEKTNFTANKLTSAVKNSDGSLSFAYILKVYSEPGQRSFDDARGLVINDYQTVLEAQWLAELKKKYPVKVNQGVVATLK
jgi:peptidyl-prolyl cis-trans isomerase SurA